MKPIQIPLPIIPLPEDRGDIGIRPLTAINPSFKSWQHLPPPKGAVGDGSATQVLEAHQDSHAQRRFSPVEGDQRGQKPFQRLIPLCVLSLEIAPDEKEPFQRLFTRWISR